MIVYSVILTLFCWLYMEYAVFLILPNVKIPSPLERSKMKRIGLLSQNEGFMHIL